MGKDDKQVNQSSGTSEISGQAEKSVQLTEADLLNKQTELKDLEDSLLQKEAKLHQQQQELGAEKESLIQQEASLHKIYIQLEESKLQAKNGFPKLLEEKFAEFKSQLEKREAQCVKEWQSIETEKEKLRQRELAVQKAEIQRDNGYASERAKIDEEFLKRRKEFETKLESIRGNLLSEIEKEVSDTKKSRLTALEKEIAEKIKYHEASLQKEVDELEQKRIAFLKERTQLDAQKDKQEYQQQRLESRKNSLEEREASLNDEVDVKVIERHRSFEYEKSALNDEIARLRDSIKVSNAFISNFEELKRKLGDEDPARVLLKLKTYEEEIKSLRDDLATRPTKEMQEAFDRLKSEKGALQRTCERLDEENNALRSSAREQSDLELELAQKGDESKSWQRRYEAVDADNNRLVQELKRLQASYEREQDREARIRDIETPYITKELPRSTENIDELQWLDRISKACIDYGLVFPRRILHAFHTALKTSEWSPITVLAGVSGTGKSELPRLYSHFGGINFMSLPVQPNWDSQESMLGFFNSIDNKFDAQPVLRLLAQSQKAKTGDYPLGLDDVMNLVLLDEMNLAHIELYFPDFLSKLELRRGRKGNEVPSLEVKLGAGIPHYDLPLGRNVLWAGTMNQDETTKSLSDKVLDRGIIINFPRPTKLERRLKLLQLGDPAPLISRRQWQGWWCRESKFNENQILPFKAFVEEMNASLSKVGRALGHRVWQSIEYYMSNYPDVMQAQKEEDDALLVKAMKIAFEDQLVQKIMPKLRGIETRGKSKTDCLDKIRTQLVNNDYSIIDDFDLACEFGYGQFIWNSANYLKEDVQANGLETAEN